MRCRCREAKQMSRYPALLFTSYSTRICTVFVSLNLTKLDKLLLQILGTHFMHNHGSKYVRLSASYFTFANFVGISTSLQMAQ